MSAYVEPGQAAYPYLFRLDDQAGQLDGELPPAQ